MNLQIYIALLKFDFFFFLSFTVQFLVVVVDTKDVEFSLTIAALPITVILLILAGWWTRRENKIGMIFIIILYFAALAYFFFKLVRMYDTHTGRYNDYLPARRGLTLFAVITIVLLIVTICNAIWCTLNFGKGLKSHLQKRKVPDADQKLYYDSNAPYNASNVPLSQVQKRMTID